MILWKEIEQAPGYAISSNGRVFRFARLMAEPNRPARPGMFLKTQICKRTGYMKVTLRKKTYNIHRLVAIAFLTCVDGKSWINHIDGNRANPRLNNLEWCSPSENAIDGFRRGRANPFKGKFSEEHPASKAVIATSMTTGRETHFQSAMDAVRKGFDSSSISRCCAGRNAYHKGHYWRFSAYHAVAA